VETKKVEVIIGKIPTSPVDTSRALTTLRFRPQAPESVGGRQLVHRLIECPYCNTMSWVWVDDDPNARGEQICANCGGVIGL
jgi:hypothetical protein